MTKPLVSVSVITYQHADYIHDCLDGILMQETNFAIELLIHDDASTDGTEEIIRKYVSNYPNLIKPIYEEENQWKKGRRGSAVFNFPRAQGKYIALCEGDDYWTDPKKLKKQVDILENNDRYSMCIHNAKKINYRNKTESPFNKKKLSTTLTTKDVILRSWFSPTASFLFRNEKLPNKVWEGVNGDIMILFIISLKGNIYYTDEMMSVYRQYTTGSLTQKTSKRNAYKNKINFLKKINKHSNYRFCGYVYFKMIKTYAAYLLKVKFKILPLQ